MTDTHANSRCLRTALQVMQHARLFSHEAVCNAVIDLNSGDSGAGGGSVAEAAGCYLVVAAMLDTSNDRLPAVTAITSVFAEHAATHVALKRRMLQTLRDTPPTADGENEVRVGLGASMGVLAGAC